MTASPLSDILNFAMSEEDKLFALHAEVCRTLGHPVRLKMVYLLDGAPRSPGELAAVLGLSPANISQHLAALRSVGVVEAQRRGTRLLYRLASPEVARACEVMRRVLLGRLERESRVLSLKSASRARGIAAGRSVRRRTSP